MVDEGPLVTLVTPVFNQAGYIKECIESVLCQDYPNIQYVVVNDGSTDEIESVLSTITGNYSIVHQENIGQARSLNKVWDLACGKYIGYLSADDRLKTNCISRMVDELESKKCVLAYPDYDLIDEKGKKIKLIKTPEFDINLLVNEIECFVGPGALFTKEAYNQIGGWNDELQQIPDYEYWLRLSQIGTFSRVPISCADYRIYKSSCSGRFVSDSRANEIVDVMTKYWSGKKRLNPRSLAFAYVICGRFHLVSGRLGKSTNMLMRSFTKYPPIFFRRRFIELFMSSFISYLKLVLGR